MLTVFSGTRPSGYVAAPLQSRLRSRPGGFPSQNTLRSPTHVVHSVARLLPSASPHRSNVWVWCRNVDLLSIDYALRPRLRSDYPWVDHPAPGTLGLAVGPILTDLSRYSYRHSLSAPLHPRFHSGFAGDADAPLPLGVCQVRGFGD
jgi:hypothetical protein